MLCLAVAGLRLAFKRLPPAYGAYAAASSAPRLWSPQLGEPLTSLDRYTLTIFPLWMAAGAWLAEHERMRVAMSALSAGLLAFFTFQFATWAFIA